MENRKKIEFLIPKAIILIEKKFPQNELPKELKGYVDGFSASIVQNGVLPAVFFYIRDKEDVKFKNRRLLIEIIFELFKDNITNSEFYLEECVKDILMDMQNNKGTISRNFKRKIITSTIAVKLALKVFKFTELEEGEVNE